MDNAELGLKLSPVMVTVDPGFADVDENDIVGVTAFA